jgi:hypothetical protein
LRVPGRQALAGSRLLVWFGHSYLKDCLLSVEVVHLFRREKRRF